ncbi:MAG: phosphoglucomutase [Verrucomicrobia bacterium]|nr:MAG: phosphoglucomutase [Verrucomicrobiota bacterium]
MNTLTDRLDAAVVAGELLSASRENILGLLQSSSNPLYAESIGQLATAGEWAELNDRFFQKLAFGTGGMRARTIGKVVTAAEQGTPTSLGRPEFPAVGTNCLNYYNLSRATQGLVRYLRAYFLREGLSGRPSLAIAHDTRHFSREFAVFCAQVAAENGCDVHLFEAPRSTPQLSFAVRQIGATAGVVLTASHNPPHDNGFKVYFNDGAQVVQPHANGIIAEFANIPSESYTALPRTEQGTVSEIGVENDGLYMERLESLLLQPELVAAQSDLKIVFSNLHGVGGAISPAMLRRLKFRCSTVAAQDVPDGRFPTVDSPNPENGPALKMAMEQADAEGADLVLATDPDCDRMGVAVRNREGKLQLLTGNMIGCLMGYYRIKTFFELGILNESNRDHAVWVKTLVTSPLQDAIARGFGIHCVNTLTGFKYIGEKLRKYEQQLPAEMQAGYRQIPLAESRSARLRHSRFFVFGGEESYGYLGDDFLRDKDGNGAVVMFAEVAAYAKSRGVTLPELLDEIYERFGYYLERGESIYMEGASGAAQIQKLANSYRDQPPTEVDGVAVSRVRNFFNGGVTDEEGDLIPAEKMLIIDLADGRSFAVRPSGTEPKIKYYLFGSKVGGGGDLARIKAEVADGLGSLWAALQADIERRVT